MNERIVEQAIKTLGIAFMAGRALVALSRSHAFSRSHTQRGNEKDDHGQTRPVHWTGGPAMPPPYIESRPVVSEANLKALDEALAFIKKANSAKETLKQTRLSLSSLESFEAYTIAHEAIRSRGKDLLKGRDFGVFLKTIESAIEALLKSGNVSPDTVEDTRVFFSQLMHLSSSKSSQLLMKEGTVLSQQE